MRRIIIEEAGKILHEDPEHVAEEARAFVRDLLKSYGIAESEVSRPTEA